MDVSTSGGEPIRVLLVDDQALLRESFRRLLELEGPKLQVVGTAGDGVEAVAAVDRLVREGHAPDVVLMDVRMPRLNGVEATRQIQARWPQVRVMMLTTFDDEEYIVEGLYAGAKSYVLKDTSAEQLVQSIEAVHRGESPLTPSVAAKLVARFTRGPNDDRAPAASAQPPSSGAASTTPSAAQVAAGHRPPAPGDDLTEREREIVRLLARGDSNREIGEALFITEGTVKNHVSNILGKLGLRDRTQAALWARERGLA
jgi:DNA-binding NarL/FixJ family response regulator